MNARARIHAMFPLDEAATAELDTRLDALVAAALHQAADEIDAHCEQFGVLGVGSRLRHMAGAKATPQEAEGTPEPAVRFEEPAPRAIRGAAARQAFADELRARPKEWAPLGAYSTSGSARSSAHAIRRAIEAQDQPFAPAGSFEAEARSMLGEYRVYVRFVGGGGR